MSRATTRGAVCAAAISAFLLAGVLAAAAAAPPLVRAAHSGSLQATILVDRSGHTLYHLSVERQGHFICTNAACLAFWQPLLVAKGSKPTGTAHLGTVKRPDGRIQVTYKGGPLYTFVQDARRGDTKGEGFKDVGVWHAATIGTAAVTKTSSPGAYGGYGG